MSKRNFSKRARVALYIAADGKCQICGAELETGWHADHIEPYSVGGATDVINGQALCPQCNLKKGAKQMTHPSQLIQWPEHLTLRIWQGRAFIAWHEHERENFLVVATPGAGKTRFALRVVYDFLQIGNRRVIIVCPTEHLKRQWADKAHEVGIDIEHNWQNSDGVVPRDFHGVAVTYHQVASGVGEDLLRRMCSMNDTIVIFDEIHHAGEGKSWGKKIKSAFEPAKHRLLLSGTPFRSDNEQIPFVHYENNRSVSDFEYGYTESLYDGICRPIFFPTYEGKIEWLSRKGELKSARFEDRLNLAEASERLKTALHPKGEWLKQVIAEAHAQLLEVRDNPEYPHPNAGGLIICRDQNHAKKVALLVQSITKTTPVIAISDDPKATEHIEMFAKGNQYWLVAVKMVSEGVDIPRLRVGVYATNVATELYFRQSVGRFVRTIRELDYQPGYFYMPAEEALVAYAQAIKEERDHELTEEEVKKKKEEEENLWDTPTDIHESFYTALTSEAEASDVIFDESVLTQTELNETKEFLRKMGAGNLDAALFARMLSEIKSGQATRPDTKSRPKKYAERNRLRQTCNKMASRIAFMTHLHQAQVHQIWQDEMGGSPQAKATEEELRRKKVWLADWIYRIDNGR